MAFNLRYYGNFRSKKKDQFWRVEISQKDYQGAAEEILLTAEPLTVTWEKQGDDFYETVKASEANCSIFCTEQFKFTELFTQRTRILRMDIFRNTVHYWRGYVIPDNYSEAFSAPPYHVDVKAVDGFANLDNVPFLDSTGKQFTGRKSLLQCISLCVSSLELDLVLSDWFDVYPEGADEGVSALGQIYLNMPDLYLANPDPTMRDVLDICLQPFGGQIFQSNGAINIRRIIALKDTVRPLSYFNIAKTLDEKWIITADGQHLIDADGNIISVQCARERLDDMWDGDELVKNTNTLSISPAIKAIKIKFADAELDNFAKRLDLMNAESWTKTNIELTRVSRYEITGKSRHYQYGRRIIDQLTARRDSGSLSTGSFSYDIPIETDSRQIVLKFGYRTDMVLDTSSQVAKYRVSCVYGNEVKDWSKDEQGWVSGEQWIELEKIDTGGSVSLEMNGAPANGVLRITFDIHTFAVSANQAKSSLWLYDFELSLGESEHDKDTDDDSFDYYRTVDVNCTSEIELSLPVASVNRTPNFRYSYSLYYVDSEGAAINLFHTLGRHDSGTLLDHLVRQILQFHSRAAMIISGDIRSGKHIDMNTVIVDDLYLNRSFYINAQEIDCRGDNFNVEMKELVGDALAQADDGDFHRVELEGTPVDICQVEGYIIYTVLSGSSRKVYSLNSYSGESLELFTIGASDKIYASGEYLIVKDATGFTAYYPDGKVFSSWAGTSYTGAANAFFPMGDNLLYLTDRTERRPGESERVKVGENLMLADPRTDYLDSEVGRFGNLAAGAARYEGGVIIIQYNSLSNIFDIRQSMNLLSDSVWTNVVALNDMYMVNSNSGLKVYSRQSLAMNNITQVATIASADMLALGSSEVTYAASGTLHRILLPGATEESMNIGTTQAAGDLKGIFYIDSVLWIIRSNGAYRLCE